MANDNNKIQEIKTAATDFTSVYEVPALDQVTAGPEITISVDNFGSPKCAM